MRLLSKYIHWKTRNANKLISSIIYTTCPKKELEMGVPSVVINITKSFEVC